MDKKIVFYILLTIFILLSSCMPSLAEEEIEWNQELEGTILDWGGSVEIDGYVIRAEDFNENKLAFVSISKDGEELERGALSNGYTLVYNDEIKVYADEVKPNYEVLEKDGVEFKTGKWSPTIRINVFLRGKPDIDINLETGEESYDPKNLDDWDRNINATIILKNTGKAKAEDLNVIIDTGELELLEGKLTHTYYSAEKDETLKKIDLLMDMPEPLEDTDYYINVSVTGYDIKGAKFEWNVSKSIEIKKIWDLIVTKSISENRYMGELVYVYVNVRNDGICSINGITITDFLENDTGMEMVEEVDLEKSLSLKAGESAANVFKYTLLPKKPGTYTFPNAVAAFTLPNGKYEEVESTNTVETYIEGPYIVLTKKVDLQQLEVGEKLTVTLTATNTGNVDASVTVSDTLPSEAKFISGETGFREILNEGGSKTVSYMLQMNRKGKIQLPPAKASFLDLEDYKGEVYSEGQPVYVGVPIEIEAKEEESGSEETTGSEQKKDSQSSETAASGASESSETNRTEGEDDTPGFGLILTGLVISGVVGLRKKGLL
ncbi:MAG: BatD family protein [Methanosarcinaceae archaeon]|nr:BatD family protein [Methanosarcinaceae archaeon]MDD4498243.1 BatD family protein [Methanosarcinaceae archaeon]